MPYFRHDDLDFYFEEHGSGQPFVFSHGLGGNLNQVLELIGQLPETHLIVYDNRAHGRTRPLGDPAKLTFQVMAGDMAALIDHLNLPKVFVGGLSMGAGISLAFCLRHSHKVKGLVLSRPAWLDAPNPHHLAIFPVIAGFVERHGLEQARGDLEQTEFYQQLCKSHPASAESLLGLFDGQSGESMVASFRAIPASAPFESLDRLQALNVPSLVLANRNDPIHPFDLAQVLADKLPGSRFHEFPSKSDDVGAHYREFRRLVSDFVRR